MIQNMILGGGGGGDIGCETPTAVSNYDNVCTVSGLTHKPFAFARLSNSASSGSSGWTYTTREVMYCEDMSGNVLLNTLYYTSGGRSAVEYRGEVSSISYSNGTLTITVNASGTQISSAASRLLGSGTSNWFFLYVV